MKVTTTVSTKGLEARFKRLETRFRQGLEQELLTLAEDAERYATGLITVMIYNTPERGYDRTGALRDSIYAVLQRLGGDRWEIRVGASGSEQRSYALYNELGTYAGHKTFDEILADANAVQGALLRLQYGQPSKGLEPRPWTIPTAVHVARQLPDLVAQVIRRAAA